MLITTILAFFRILSNSDEICDLDKEKMILAIFEMSQGVAGIYAWLPQSLNVLECPGIFILSLKVLECPGILTFSPFLSLNVLEFDSLSPLKIPLAISLM